MPYTAGKPPLPESIDQLRERIPGWGADLDPQNRPSSPREQFRPGAEGAHWDLPEQQPEHRPRERSIEHSRLTPVFGTSSPTKGVSGVLRRLAYARFSEGRAAHWLILLGADRVDVVESRFASAIRLKPGNLIAETGVRSEFSHHGVASRWGVRRADVKHQLLDPVIVAGPRAAFAGALAYLLIRGFAAVGGRRSRHS
jgi:hypothetical protein